LRAHEDPVLAAADAYSYLHLLLVAGIIVFAVGVKSAVAHAEDPLADGARLALCGGIAVYLGGLAAFRLRLVGRLDIADLVAATAVLAVFAATGAAVAWLTELAVTAVLAILVTRELTSKA
jgi:low temperature requirement protein LtrA